MQKINKIILICCLLISGCSMKKEQPFISLEKPDEIKAIWFSYVDIKTLLKDNEEPEKTIHKIVSNCQSIGINTMYVHAVAFTDSFYDSKLYDKSSHLGVTKVNMLQEFIEQCHQQNIAVEAWINMFRSVTVEEMDALRENHVIKNLLKEQNALSDVKGRYYLNPSHPKTKELILSVVEELMGNYNIDGIHMDDYFYPMGATEEFDKITYNLYKQENETLADFRRRTINDIIASIHQQLHGKITLSISPSGNYNHSKNDLYADPQHWINNKTVDMIIPQLYYGYTHKTLPYTKALEQWQQLVDNTDLPLLVGLAAYKVGDETKSETNEWVVDHDVLLKQLDDAKKSKNYKGFALLSYCSLFHYDKNKEEIVEKLILSLKQSK